MAQRELFLIAPNRDILTYLLTYLLISKVVLLFTKVLIC